MKKIYPFLILLCTTFIKAQTINAGKLPNTTCTPTLTILNGSVINLTTTSSASTVSKIYFKNTSALTQTYTVFRTIILNSPPLDISCSTVMPETWFTFGFTAFPNCINTPGPSDYTILGPNGSTSSPFDNSCANGNPFYIYLDEGASIGLYHVRYKLANVNNTNDTLSFILKYNITLDLKEPSTFLETISIYPNPASDDLNINFQSEPINTKYVVRNALGKQIDSGILENKNNYVLVSNLSAGIYFIQITNGEHTYTNKFIKK